MSTDLDMTHNVLQLVNIERIRQERKWGPTTHTRLEWLAILTEEVGELAKGLCDEWIHGQDQGVVHEELVHVAAVAVAALEDLLPPSRPAIEGDGT